MQIFLHLLDGSQQIVNVEGSQTVETLLSDNGISGSRLVYQGSVLNSDHDLANLNQGANLYVNTELEGGKRKKKKKVYTTKKKNKHIHKKIKNITLTLYSVDGNSFSNSRQRKRHLSKENLPSLRKLHGPALGSLLLWILSHHHQDGPRNC